MIRRHSVYQYHKIKTIKYITMSKKLILLFSHQLTDKQKQNAQIDLGVLEFVGLPNELQKKWSNVPPDSDSISDYFSDLKLWLLNIVKPDDYILIQGDFGATYMFVNWAFSNKVIPIYSTTKRIHTESSKADGTIDIRKTFEHKIFRVYSN